jgi:putative redox protein
MRSVTIAWDESGHRFTALGKNTAFTIATDAPLAPGEEREPTGFSPTELLLAGAGACSAWDVLNILRKQRAALADLSVVVEGEQSDLQPHPYTAITLHFRLTGDRIKPGDVRRAIRLSVGRYCSVLATVSATAKVDSTYELVSPTGESTGRTAVDLPV